MRKMYSVTARPQRFTSTIQRYERLKKYYTYFGDLLNASPQELIELDDKAIQWFIATKYNPFGETPVGGVIMEFPMEAWEWDMLQRSAIADPNSVDTRVFDINIGEILKKVGSKKVSVGFSGGVDSTYLLAKCKSLELNVEAVNVSFEKYDESVGAKLIAEQLDVPFRQVRLSREIILHELPIIIEKLGTPHDRGGTIPTYFLCKNAEDVLVVGDYADTIFGPSMGSELRALKAGHLYWMTLIKQDLKEMTKLFKNLKISVNDFPFWVRTGEPPYNMIFWDIRSINTYGNRHRYCAFHRKDQEVLLPFADINLLQESIMQLGLHDLSGQNPKRYLRYLCGEYAGMHRCLAPKKPMCFRDMGFVVDKFLKPSILREMGLFNDVNFFKLSPSIKYLLSLLCLWWEVFLK